MKRTFALVVAVSVLMAGILPAMAAAQPSEASAASAAIDDATIVAQADENATDENATDENETDDAGEPDENATENAAVSPGARLAGALGAQEAEFQGEMEQRAFGHQVAAAATNGSKAQVLAHTHERLQERLNATHERLQELKQARENGTMSEARYQAEVTEIAAETAAVRHMGNSTERAAWGLPADVLEQNGVNVTAIHQLQTQAHNMTGQEVRDIARSIAGNHVGQRMGPPEGVPGGPPSDAPGGPGMHDQNRTDDDQAGHGQSGQGQSGHGQGGQGNMTAPDDRTNTTATNSTATGDATNTTDTTADGE